MEKIALTIYALLVFALLALLAGAVWQLRATRVPLSRTVGADLESDTVRKMETRLKNLELEWTNTYDKLNRLAGRLARERGLLAASDGASSTPAQDALDLTSPVPEKRSEVLKRWHSRARVF